MADLGDRGAIAWKRDRPVVDDPVKEPALDRVVIAGTDDVGGAEAREGNPFAHQPGLGFSFAGVTAGWIERAVLRQRPDVAPGIHTR